MTKSNSDEVFSRFDIVLNAVLRNYQACNAQADTLPLDGFYV